MRKFLLACMQFHSKYNSLDFCWNQITIKRTEFLVESNIVHPLVHSILTYFDYIHPVFFILDMFVFIRLLYFHNFAYTTFQN